MDIVKTQVFDPALHGAEALPARFEIMLTGEDDWDTKVFSSGEYVIEKYGPFIGFTLDTATDERPDVGRLNVAKVLPEPVFPVTVSEAGGMWYEYYLPVSRVRQMLRKMNNLNPNPDGYVWELQVNETYANEGDVVFELDNTSHVCVRCFREGNFTPGIERVKAQPHRQVWLCGYHLSNMKRHRGLARAGRSPLEELVTADEAAEASRRRRAAEREGR